MSSPYQSKAEEVTQWVLLAALISTFVLVFLAA